MEGKIIALPASNITRKIKGKRISVKMINALAKAYVRQLAGIAFGQEDVKGSFIYLIKRGLIAAKQNKLTASTTVWEVTKEGISMLENSGVKVSY